jgi:site-specific DNA recombinase
MVFRMMAVLNEFERDQVSERTKAALAHKKETNQVYNHTPYGYKRSGMKLIPENAEVEARKKMFKLRTQGHSLRAIARDLNDQGIPSKQGGQWYASSVRNAING